MPRIFSACFRQVGPPAAAAAHASGHLLDNLAGVQLLGQVFGHSHHQRHLAVRAGAQRDHTRPQFLPQHIHQRAHGAAVNVLNYFGQHRYVLHPAHPLHQLVHLLVSQAALGSFQLFLQLSALLGQTVNRLQQVAVAHPQLSSQLLHCGLRLLVLRQGNSARHGFHPAHTGGHAGFGNHFQHPDLAGALHVRAAAEFLAEETSLRRLIGNRNHAHVLLRVLVAEESQRATVQRRFQIHPLLPYRRITQDVLVRQPLNFV